MLSGIDISSRNLSQMKQTYLIHIDSQTVLNNLGKGHTQDLYINTTLQGLTALLQVLEASPYVLSYRIFKTVQLPTLAEITPFKPNGEFKKLSLPT